MNQQTDLPYEMTLTRMPNQQHNLKDVLIHNKEIWLDIFKKHLANGGQKYIKQGSNPSFSIYRTPYDAMQASPMNDREES